jgi:hypothetical protein
MNKEEVARRQLGTALDMFLRGQDPVSVHSLTMSGAVIAEFLAEKAGGEPFRNHVLDGFPELDVQEVRNAFKHASNRSGVEKDDDVLEEFHPSVNDHALLVGWWDYGASGLPRPIEAQAFEGWYRAKYPEKADPAFNMGPINHYFSELTRLSPERQHSRLIDVIRKARKIGAVMSALGTDRRPLVLPWSDKLP